MAKLFKFYIFFSNKVIMQYKQIAATRFNKCLFVSKNICDMCHTLDISAFYIFIRNSTHKKVSRSVFIQ